MDINTVKKVHVIGICGVATSALAIAFHNKGIKVSGSDKGFYPPVSTELEKTGINFYAGWHPEKMSEGGDPDIIIIGTASGSANPETIYAKEKNIKTYSFAEAIGEFFVKEKSIVCAGTWGKTSSSTLLSFILEKANYNPTYMFGGISLSHESSAKLTDSKWSVFEGDEYKSSPTDNNPKFFYYKPTHLLLSAVSWDHADLYPTEESYFAVFNKLVSDIPEDGLIVYCKDHTGANKILNNYSGHSVTYGKKYDGVDYGYYGVEQNKNGLHFTIENDRKCYEIISPMIGEFQAENITGAFAMASSLGIVTDDVVSAIREFKGLKRRLEKRFEGEGASKKITVFDDIAHSPEKANSVLESLRKIYKGKITVVFEPNIGARRREIVHKYDNAFKFADEVIIPRLTKLKISSDENTPIDGEELNQIISKTHKNSKYIDDDNSLVEYLIENSKDEDIIAFLGAHGFRNMIEETVSKLKNNK
ncbi:MAG: Mur ligase family protein [bacterium]|nr:Mur ligase family protein [bacterium]